MSPEPDPHVSRRSLSFHQDELPKGLSYLSTGIIEFPRLVVTFYTRVEFLEVLEVFKMWMVFHEKYYKNNNNSKNAESESSKLGRIQIK